jgi:hypothetical protein
MGARQRLLKQPLTEIVLAKDLCRLLPRQNNYCAVNHPELLGELQYFGIKNRRALRRLILKNIRKAIQIDREPFDALNAKIQREELGIERFLFLERRKIFFGLEGLMRIILELEFEDRYREFADRRRDSHDIHSDIIDNP